MDAQAETMETGNQKSVALKKRTLAEMKGVVSEDELEAYKRARAVADDPMARFLDKDQYVH